MDEETAVEQSVGRITSGIEVKLSLQAINFVRLQLPDWRDDSDRPDEQSEPRLNAQLCNFLNRRAKTDFPMVLFNHEEPQKGHGRVDLSATPSESTTIESKQYGPYEPFLVLECKRLPPPSLDREKEYVTGEASKPSGGIQRFKLGLYAADLDLVGIIGYVQKCSARHWHRQINEWISQLSTGMKTHGCVWADSEQLGRLEEDSARGMAFCRSVHTRTGTTAAPEITIHHLWIAMSAKRPQS
jgi:hypothetical protein